MLRSPSNVFVSEKPVFIAYSYLQLHDREYCMRKMQNCTEIKVFQIEQKLCAELGFFLYKESNPVIKANLQEN